MTSTVLLADLLRAGMNAALLRENGGRQRPYRSVDGFIKDKSPHGGALAKAFSRLPERDDQRPIKESTFRSLCTFMRDNGAADHARICEDFWQIEYLPILPILGKRPHQLISQIEQILIEGGFEPNALVHVDSRAAALNQLVQSPIRFGNADTALRNLALLNHLAEGTYLSAKPDDRFQLQADIAITARHALFRLGFEREEIYQARRIADLLRDAKHGSSVEAKLSANHLSYLHSTDMLGDASLNLFRSSRHISVAGLGAGRVYAYAADSAIYRGHHIDDCSLLGISIREALTRSYAIAMENKDFDGAIRSRTVVARAMLWQGDWFEALGELEDIWKEVVNLRRDLPQAEMLLKYTHYIALKIAQHHGMKDAGHNAQIALLDAKHISFKGKAPILSPNHKLQFRRFGKARNIILDLGT